MNFHSLVSLTDDEDAFIDSAIDEILGIPNPFAQRPEQVVAVLSFLQEDHYLSPWFSQHIQDQVIGQRFLHSPQAWVMPMRLSLNEFIL
jgi:hypothetical protein